MACGTDQSACNLTACCYIASISGAQTEGTFQTSFNFSNFRSIKEDVKNMAPSILKICKNDYRFLLILIFPQFLYVCIS